ncbi:hypothetical protein PVAND_004436 [Polypedilum vanderplanki]|uniref:Uncharacterized protein n=1 Tax=Polypedilum vanderplanki TaxID=319348 RepID=A0A9J6BY39_POLVA|nr:hypothetical protein PVAND_004436 [Polypedilum vanderplanki]
MSFDTKDMIGGSASDLSDTSLRLIEAIASNKDFSLSDQALNFPNELAIGIFNYPIIKNDKYKEFAEATKRISSAKYAYYKKSAIFKDNITKLILNTFNKHHQQIENLEHSDQIMRVKTAEKIVKFIGELYLSEFYTLENLVWFCESLRKNSQVSKISEDCLATLIEIVADQVNTESKQYKHNIHIAAILNIIKDFESRNTQLKKNYKDLEIIEAVKKNKSLSSYSSKNEVTRQLKKICQKIFEMVLSSSLPLSECIQKASETSIIFPNTFESEILQLCVDYLKRSFETNNIDIIMSSACPRIVVFIGKIFYDNIILNESIRNFLSFLNRDIRLSKQLYNMLIGVIYDKIINEDDEALKLLIPSDYIHGGVESEETTSDKEVESEMQECVAEVFENGKDDLRPSSSSSSIMGTSSAHTPLQTPKHKPKAILQNDSLEKSLIITSINENASDPIDKFKELLNKLSPTNVLYILREISQIRFTCSEEVVKKLATIIVDHAINKQTLIKPIVEIAVKLHETIVPHFNSSYMRKHLKAVISSKISKCSEKESTGYCQLVNELHKSNCYDRFDVIILLESFIANFNSDRTALPSLLKFTSELEEVIGSKKLSKNMKLKLQNVAQILTTKLNEDIHVDNKKSIEHALTILRGETNTQKENKLKREDSNEEYVDVFDYRYDGANDEYIINVESLTQNSAKISLVPSAKTPTKQQQSPPLQNLISKPETFPNSSSQNNFISPIPIQPPGPFILPPMNQPPPVLLIPPPTFLPNQFNTPPPPCLPQQQLNPIQPPLSNASIASALFPSLLETVENRRDSSLIRDDNIVRSMNEDFNQIIVNDLDQSGLSSAADMNEMQINDNVSDYNYDTVSNAESSSNSSDNENSESAYSSLKDDRDMINQEEKFKNFIRNNMSCDINEVEKFVEAFIRRGIKCRTSGFIKLIDIIKEGLDGNELLFNSFLQILETRIYEHIKCLSLKEILTFKEQRNSLQLILLAAETYNEGLMSNNTLFECLDILFDNIINGKCHQITLFHQMIKITLDKVLENGYQFIYKNYLDKLSKRAELFNDSHEKNLLSWEIFITMKVLLYRTQQANLKCPVTCFKLFLKNLKADNFSININELKNKLKVDKKQLTEIVDIYISAARDYDLAILVEIGNKLKNLSTYNSEELTFKKYLESKAHHDIKYCLMNLKENEKMTKLINTIQLIGSLYYGNVISIYLVLCALEMMLEKEVFNTKIVDAISILLRKVGFKIDEESVLILDKFFLYFNHISNSEKSYRSLVYKNLIKLRANNWILMENERNVEKIEELLTKLNNINEQQIGMILSNFICKSVEIFKSFIETLWKYILSNQQFILRYAKLIFFISRNHQNFQYILMSFLNKRNQTFEKISNFDKLSNNIIAKLSTVTRFVAYCYVLDCASEDDLLLWLKPNFIKHFTVEDKTELQMILGQRVNDGYNNKLKGILGLIEIETKQYIFSTLESVKTNLKEL